MNLTELFNPSFFLLLGILILFIGLLVIYFESKFRDQNHKISSMVSLVSSMAEELNIMRGRLQMILNGGVIDINSNNIDNLGGKLINVSDDEHDEDDTDDENEEDETDDDNEEDETDDEDEDEAEEEDDFNKTKILKINNSEIINIGDDVNEIKVLNFGSLKKNDSNENFNEEPEEIDLEDDDLDDLDMEDDFEEDDKKNIVEEENESENINETIMSDLDIFKTINISNLDDSDSKQMNILEYKKLSLARLRTLVVEKGFATDSSKMKKQEILKLFGIE